MPVLSLALLFAQLGMVVHASSHLRADPHAAPAQGQPCVKCASFAPLQNVAGGTATALLVVQVIHDRAFESAAAIGVPVLAFTAFRSRAPPFLPD